MKTSIIILTHNKLEYTKKCIESIRKFTEELEYEIIVIDNCSSDETPQWISEQTDIISILNKENVGFPKGCNQGIEVATGDNILLLNNDIIVTPNWLNNLLIALHSSPKVGAVGPVTNNASYGQVITVSYKDDEEMLVFAKEYNQSDSLKWIKRLKLIGFCLLFKKEVFDRIGYLDETFTPGNFEDDDYCLRIINQGYELLLCQDTFIHHYGSVSFSDKPVEFIEVLINNHEKFKTKWGIDPGQDYEIKYGLIRYVTPHQDNSGLRILDVGGHCGATALEIMNNFKNTTVDIIEENPSAALIASHFGNVISFDINYIDRLQTNQYDYILVEQIESLINPDLTLNKLKRVLKNDGNIIIAAQNKMYYKQILGLLDQRNTNIYHLLLIPKYEKNYSIRALNEMLLKNEFQQITFTGIITEDITVEDNATINKLVSLSGYHESQFIPSTYIITAKKE